MKVSGIIGKRILLLTNDRGNMFWSSTKNTRTLCTVDVAAILRYLREMGYDVQCNTFSEIDMSQDYRGVFVWYTSSEDYFLLYKSYIEDVILALIQKGAVPITRYELLRAHHNKVEMELLRAAWFPEQSKQLTTYTFGAFEAFEQALRQGLMADGKWVVKTAFGAGSQGVALANNQKELVRIARKMSRSYLLFSVAQEMQRRVLWRGYYPESLHRKKFVIQAFIPSLRGDFKILRYGDRFYTLYRVNRENDFRASGGGRLSFTMPPEIDMDALLNYSKQTSDTINSPFCSMDIAFDGQQWYLLEFQSISFGPYTAERSEWHWTLREDGWQRVEGACDLPRVMCDAVDGFIRRAL